MFWVLVALGTADANPYRAVNRDRGNCIVSGWLMPVRGEATYREVRESFDTDRPPREVRCYLSAPLGQERKHGRHYSELRDEELWHNRLVIRDPSGEPSVSLEADYAITRHNQHWDQARMQIWSTNGHCDFKKGGSCVDLESEVRQLAREADKTLPYTAELCFSLFFRYTNTYIEVYDKQRGITTQSTNMQERVLAEGCVEYTVLGEGYPMP